MGGVRLLVRLSILRHAGLTDVLYNYDSPVIRFSLCVVSQYKAQFIIVYLLPCIACFFIMVRVLYVGV